MDFKKSKYYRATLKSIDPDIIKEEEILAKGNLTRSCHLQYGCGLWNQGFEKMLSENLVKEDIKVMLLGVEYVKLFLRENKEFLKDIVKEIYG